MRTLGLVIVLWSTAVLAGTRDPFLQTTVLRDVQCGLFAPDGSVVMTDRGHDVIVGWYATRPAIVVCHGQVPAPGVRMTLDAATTGQSCGCGRAETLDWHEEITPDGQATLTCFLPPSP